MLLILEDGRNERKQIGVASDGSRVHWTRANSQVRVYHHGEKRFLKPGEWAWEEIARKQNHATDTYKELRSASDSVGETNDCAVVAYAAVTGVSYADARYRMFHYGRKNRDGTNFTNITKPALLDAGFVVIPCRGKFHGRGSFVRSGTFARFADKTNRESS